jgi:hypothetical protein
MVRQNAAARRVLVMVACAAPARSEAPPALLAVHRFAPFAIAADASGVYWTEGECHVVTMRDGRGPPTLLAALQPRGPNDPEPQPIDCPIAVDDRQIYVAFLWRIWAIPKRGGAPVPLADAPDTVALAVDAQRFYCVRRDGAIVAVARSGGAPTELRGARAARAPSPKAAPTCTSPPLAPSRSGTCRCRA